MKGDFAKAVFEPLKRFAGVFFRQGRVRLDADAAARGESQPTSTAGACRDANRRGQRRDSQAPLALLIAAVSERRRPFNPEDDAGTFGLALDDESCTWSGTSNRRN